MITPLHILAIALVIDTLYIPPCINHIGALDALKYKARVK